MRRVLTVVSACVLVIACGSSGDNSNFGDNSNDIGSSGASGGGTLGMSSGASGGSSGASGAGMVMGVSPNDACASSNAGTQAPPISLVFMFDRSGSMYQNPPGANVTKWDPAVAAMKAFFSDPANSTISASLQFFPEGSTSKSSSPGCQVSTYATPAVTMRPLPDAAFGPALDANVPNGGGTPTLPAETGAVQYAQSLVAGLKPGESIAIVLITDGDPNDCNSTPGNVASEAATVAATIKTYVVGVGPDATNLDTIATGGGTAPHIQVDTSSATTTASDLKAAVQKIKAAQLGCNYPLPAPPNGQTLDVNAVNVNYTTGGVTKTLPYSADCKDPGGWHYDNVAAPTQIVMCSDICNTLKADTSGGKIDIIFGCVTTVGSSGSLPH